MTSHRIAPLCLACAAGLIAAAMSGGVAAQAPKKTAPAKAPAAATGVHLVRDDANRRVDVFIDGQPFTAYIYPTTLKKPVLYPLRTAKGSIVTRGFPLDPRPGERVDHPHQVGVWFNYGNVNGIDFWNNSDAIKPEDRGKMGTIVHRAVTAVRDGADEGELEVDMDWVMPDGKPVLREHTRFVFRGGPGSRSIDRMTTLQAPAGPVSFTDNKEGVIGMRVARALETPSDKPEVFTDAAGRATTVKTMDNTGVNGVYLTSEGRKGDGVWGTRGRWCTLSGKVGEEPVTVALLDHPSNPGFPTYWHARGYGLFAANPLGQKELSGGKETLDFTLAPNQSVTFSYRILILSEIAPPERVEGAYREFTAKTAPTTSTIAAQAPANTLTEAEKRDGSILLFDGRTTRGWRAFHKPDMAGLRWAAEDGWLCVPKAEGGDTKGRRDIISDRKFSDFDLTWDWKIAPGGNSGVKYFITEERKDAIGHEYQLLDDDVHPDGKIGPHRRTAAFYDVLPARNAKVNPVGQVNHSRVLVRGSHVEHWLNGDKVLEYELGSPEVQAAIAKSKFKDVAGFGTSFPGHILLQDHGEGICFQNIKIRELKAGGKT